MARGSEVGAERERKGFHRSNPPPRSGPGCSRPARYARRPLGRNVHTCAGNSPGCNHWHLAALKEHVERFGQELLIGRVFGCCNQDMDRAMLERSLAALKQVRGNAAPGRALSPVEAFGRRSSLAARLAFLASARRASCNSGLCKIQSARLVSQRPRLRHLLPARAKVHGAEAVLFLGDSQFHAFGIIVLGRSCTERPDRLSAPLPRIDLHTLKLTYPAPQGGAHPIVGFVWSWLDLDRVGLGSFVRIRPHSSLERSPAVPRTTSSSAFCDGSLSMLLRRLPALLRCQCPA